jgi:DNA-binding response OmpR family regulator
MTAECPICRSKLETLPGYIDPQGLTISKDDASVRLTSTEFAIFTALFKAKGRALTFDYLLAVLENGRDMSAEMNTLRVYITRLRKKFDGLNISIEPVYTVGWRMPPFHLLTLGEAV